VIASGAGAASRRSLGTAVFGGMLVATALGVVMTPIYFLWMQRLSRLIGFGGRARGGNEPLESPTAGD